MLRGVLSDAEFDRWESLLLQRALDRMQDLARCPRCQAVCVGDEEGCARCPACLHVFCARCRDGWHTGRYELACREAFCITTGRPVAVVCEALNAPAPAGHVDRAPPRRACVAPGEAMRQRQEQIAQAGGLDADERRRRMQALRDEYRSHLVRAGWVAAG